MSFSYDVMSETEAMSQRFQLLPDGEYRAVVTGSEDKRAKSSGNAMMDMIVSIINDGKVHEVRDFLVFTKSMMWKAIHCADSAGLLPEYEQQKFCSDLIRGKPVVVKIVTEEGDEIPIGSLNGKPMGSKYPPKNKIADYLKDFGEIRVQQNMPVEEKIKDDDIPF